ncbi:zinc finger CCCH domain-containing protein 19 [Tanacetum coccineum]
MIMNRGVGELIRILNSYKRELQEEGEINDKKEQMGYEMNAPGKSVDSFEEGEIIGESNDGCVKDCMGKKLDDDVEKDIEDCSNNVIEKCGVVNNNMSNNVEGEILEDHFDGDRGNDTIEDNADVNPSTNVSLEVNIPRSCQWLLDCVLTLTPPDNVYIIAKESCSTWLDYVGPLITDELDSEKCWSYRDPKGNIQGSFSLAQLHINQLLFSSKVPRKDVIFDDIVSRSFTWRISRCEMDIQRKHKILVVDPESNCRLLDIDSGVFHLIIEFNKPLVYQYHDPLAKDYLTMLGDAFGNMHIYRHIKHVSSNMACYPQEEEDIDMLLETQYGGAAKCFRSSETIFVNSENGEIMSEEESDNSFKIVRNNREMKLSSSSGFQTCIKWQLNYSTFQAFYPLVNQEVRDTIRVFHTLNPHEFYKFCKDFHVKDQYTTRLLENVKWKLRDDDKSRIQVFEKCVNQSNLKLGEYQTLTVGVENSNRWIV